ncbi:MAG TPA: DUF4194 domain-containing protein [Steroidobacter sp.]|nr:DUF4194 domain-containing protein [Steroidobacter sp.]
MSTGSLQQYLEGRMEAAAVPHAQLQELLIRLLNYGVLVRDESQTTRELYDRFRRIEPVVTEVLDLFGIELHHERKFEYVRLYPPGSRRPGMDNAEEQAFGGSLRARLSQHEIALILVLRAQYDKAIREGKLDDRGFATEPLEAIGLAMKNWLGRSLPDKATERRNVFRRLRQLKLIEYREEEDLDQAEAWVRVHPMIVDFVSNEAIEALAADGGTATASEVEHVP